MKGLIRSVAVAAVVFRIVTSTGAQTLPPRLEVFNSFKYSQETGDLMGMEVILLRTKSGACVSYQEAEGGPGQSRILSAVVRGDSLFFTIPPDSGYELHVARGVTDTSWVEIGPASRLRGRIHADGLSVRIDSRQSDSGWLPRRRRAYFAASERKLLNTVPKPIGDKPRGARDRHSHCY